MSIQQSQGDPDGDTERPPQAEGVLRLPSLAALQALHKEFLQVRRQDGDSSALWERVADLIRRGQLTGALLDTEEDRSTAQAILDYWSAILFKADYAAPDATLAEFDPDLAPEIDDALCPYVGLDPFQEENRDIFFGRERIVTSLLERLKDERLLVVVGPSGCGKSSIVLAGLLPALKNGALPSSSDWRYAPSMVPGSNPLANLVRVVLTMQADEIADPVAWAREQEAALRCDPQHLAELANTLSPAPIVGVVDQFEELFTLCSDDTARCAFLDNLINLVRTPGGTHRVILTMRTDFESRVARYPEFQALFEPATVRVTPLFAPELREAIEKPAQKVGLKFETGLVDQLLHDVLGEPAALPLLQFTLLKLWDHRVRNRITWQAYNRLGGGRNALKNSADEFFDHLIHEDRTTAKRIFMRLVTTESQESTSNRVRLRDLYQTGEASDRVQRMIDKLIAARLVRITKGDIAADAQIEVAHEALVRNWPRLMEWLEEKQHTRRQRQAVADAAERWNVSGRDPGALYTTETLLIEAQHIIEKDDRPPSEQEAQFIEASKRVQEQARQAEETTRQRELEQATKLAEAERQRADEQTKAAERLRRLTMGLILLALAALLAAALAVSSARTAGIAQATAEAGATQVAANLKVVQDSLGAQVSLIDQVATAAAERATLVAQVQTLSPASTPSSVSTQTPATTSTRTPRPRPSQTSSTEQAGTPTRAARPSATPTMTPTRTPGAMMPPADLVTTATAVALATQRSQVLATQTAIAGQKRQVVTEPRIITASQDKTVRVWNANNGQLLLVLQGHTGGIYSVAGDLQAKRILTASSDKSARIWDAYSGQNLVTITEDQGGLWSAAFSPDGNLIATASADWRVQVWDAKTGERRWAFTAHDSSVIAISYSPDGSLIATGGNDKLARIWDAVTYQKLLELAGHTDRINLVSFDTRGERVITAGGDGHVLIWDSHTGKLLRDIPAHRGAVYAAAFSPDGSRVVTSSSDRTARVWNLSSSQGPERVLSGHQGTVWSAIFSPDGRRIITGSEDQTVRIWDADTGAELMVLKGHSGPVTSVYYQQPNP